MSAKLPTGSDSVVLIRLITYEFSTQYELIFDEHSHSRRVCALREFDARRELQRQGKLHNLPLLQDDYSDGDLTSLRSIFSSPDAPPDVLFVPGGEAAGSTPRGGESQAREAASTATEDGESGAQAPVEREALPGDGDKPPAAQDLRHKSSYSSEPSQPGVLRTTLQQQATSPASKVESAGSSSHLHRVSAHGMGREAAAPEQRVHGPEHGHTAPTPTEREDTDDDTPEEYKVRGFRAHPKDRPHTRAHSRFLDSASQESPSAARKSALEEILTDRDEAEAALTDRAAAKHGPLTTEAIDIERERTKLDPRHPSRPLRHLPVGQHEKDSPDFKAFRRFALENNLLIALIDNPKSEGSASWTRYNRYQPATNLRQIIELSITSADPKVRAEQRATALKDITHDCLKGFISFPQHECTDSAHYVDAALLAKAHRTVNIHQIYSMSQLTTARREAAAKESAALLELVEAHISIAQEREARSVPLTFHTLIKSLWDYDFSLQLNETDLKNQSAFGAAVVEQLLGGGLPEPDHYRQAVAESHPERQQWMDSIARERATLEERGTWELVPRKSIGRHRPVRCRYVFKKKKNKDRSLQYKTRLVACGYSQVEGMNFSADEVYASVCAYSSMRFLFSLACQEGYILSQADITGAYLEASLDDDVYMECPPDMYVNGKPPTDADGNELVCKLKRSLNGLRQSSYRWRDTFTTFLTSDPKWRMGFKALTGEPNMYVKEFKYRGRMEKIFVCCYVDDTVIASSSEDARQWFMSRLEARFPVNPKSTGNISFDTPGLVLSMNVRYDRDRGLLEFDQRTAFEALAARVGVTTDPPRTLPIASLVDLPKLPKAEVDPIEYLSIVGAILHICQVSRPDCAYAVGILSRHSSTPGAAHLQAARNVVNYLFATRDLSIRYVRSAQAHEPFIYEKGSEVPARGQKQKKRAVTIEERLVASTPQPSPNAPDLFVDADFGGDPVSHRSTSGMVIIFNGGPITWSSRLQKLCAQSTAESEIYACTDSVKEAMHIKLLCEECGIRAPGTPLRIWEDNNACLQLAHSIKGSKAARHFAIRLRFLNEAVHDGAIEFARIDTKLQLADGFTKALPGPAFFAFRQQLLHKPS